MRLELTSEERAIAEQIDFTPQSRSPDSCRLASELMEMLEDRRAIPKVRMEYVMAAHGGKSCEHPSFLKHLRYILYGPDLDLDEETISHFRETIARWHDEMAGPRFDEIIRMARKTGKPAQSGDSDKAEEVYKLCRECGLDDCDAQAVKKEI